MKIREMVSTNPTLQITYSAIMTVIVFVFTVVFNVYIIQTRGYFNIGETGVYIAAITGGPIVGMIAGGFGSMLSDVVLGYSQYAPGTLVVKGVEGFIVGYLAMKLEAIFREKSKRPIGVLIGVLFGILMYIVGKEFYVGTAEISINLFGATTMTVDFSEIIWGLSAVIIIILVIGLSWKKPNYIGYILSTIAGGMTMVLGYFLYEQVILGVAALAEVPFNTMQMSIGTALSLLVVSAVEKIWIEKKEK
jgi:uncharacterized membrane protein